MKMQNPIFFPIKKGDTGRVSTSHSWLSLQTWVHTSAWVKQHIHSCSSKWTMHSSNWKQLLGQSCSIITSGIEHMWHTVCADILQKWHWIFSLYCGWIRHETKSSETSCLVTIQRVNHSKKFGKQDAFSTSFTCQCTLHLLFREFLSLLINLVAWNDSCEWICLTT